MSTQTLHISQFITVPIVSGQVMTADGEMVSVFRLQPLDQESRLRQNGWWFYLPAGRVSASGTEVNVYWMDSELFRCVRTTIYPDDVKARVAPRISPQSRTLLRELVRLAGNKTLKFSFAKGRAEQLIGSGFASKEVKSWPTLVTEIEAHLSGKK
ncbi:hypothetical protein [Pseudomonas sp.]|uniref:hypothetical protein n=1 Tax=Pseudomonas sp. TaxID=306 RepID=UPI0025840D3B|nr:hypothetical protein [Pseudomonas sp.]